MAISDLIRQAAFLEAGGGEEPPEYKVAKLLAAFGQLGTVAGTQLTNYSTKKLEDEKLRQDAEKLRLANQQAQFEAQPLARAVKAPEPQQQLDILQRTQQARNLPEFTAEDKEDLAYYEDLLQNPNVHPVRKEAITDIINDLRSKQSSVQGISPTEQESIKKQFEERKQKLSGLEQFANLPVSQVGTLSTAQRLSQLGQTVYLSPDKTQISSVPVSGWTPVSQDVAKTVEKNVLSKSATAEHKVFANPVTGKKYNSLEEVPESEKGQVYEVKESEAFKQAGKLTQDFPPEAIKLAADTYLETGELPPIAMFGGVGVKGKIFKMVSDNLKERGETVKSIALRKISLQADKSELSGVQKQRGSVITFERTAKANAQMVLDILPQIDNTQIPVLNRYYIQGLINVAGDPTSSNFLLRLKTFANEYARVTTTVTGGTVTSDTARKEIDEILSKSQNVDQLKSNIETAIQEMENRRLAYEQQIEETKQRVSESTSDINKEKFNSVKESNIIAPMTGETKSHIKYRIIPRGLP